MLLEWNEMTVVWPIMQISKPVKFSCRPGTGSQQYSKRNWQVKLTSNVLAHARWKSRRLLAVLSFSFAVILVPRGRAPFGQHQESRPLAKSNTGSPRFTDFPSLCACSESSLTNLIGSGLNLLYLQSHLKTECRWTRPEVAILGADQKERGLWGRERFAVGETNWSQGTINWCPQNGQD